MENKNINYWTIPCNIADYDVINAFKELQCIEWKQILNNVNVDDIIYIYVGKPYSKIMYKCKINKVNLDKVSIDDKKYWTKPNEYGTYKRYMEIELLEKYEDNELYSYNNLKKYNFLNVQGQASASEELVDFIENNNTISVNKNANYYETVNKKRVEDKKMWLKVLNNEQQENNMALDILLYLYDCKNYTSNGKNIANYFNTDVAAINSYIKSFGKRVIELLNIDEQIYNNSSRRWNIPFETIPELNNNHIFTWKLRKELIDALMEKYDLIPKEETIEEKIQQFIIEYPYDTYCKNIEKDLEARQYFVNKYTLHTIMNMSLDNFVIGRADIDNEGRDSFCYLLERSMQNLGQMRGSFVSKFGVWYSKDDNEYKFTKKYGDNLTDAFEKLKQEICFLLVSANNNNYEDISKCEIANIFKGKILSTYYPEKYLCIFDEEDVNKFLNILDIKYDILEINTLEKKKMLLQKFKETNKLLKDYSDYYFVCFLYKTFKNELKIKNTVTGEIDYNNIEFVDFDYLKRHETSRKNSYRSRETDYERINRNKKDVGNRGETAILQSEKNKLKSLGLNDLAEQVSICDNDAEGYDIISFDEHGDEIHIEVKTNSNNKTYLDFYITANELEHLMKDDKYYIYYLFNIKGKPRCHIINKKDILDKKQEFFQPVIYKVNIDVREKNKE